MCGIAGFMGFADSRRMAEDANRIQRHRGPDAEGIWTEGRLSLAHRRLSIIDLDPRSDQPMTHGGLTIVYNGELYNFREIRDRLIREHNATFSTESDTEVILEAYRAKGEKCLEDFVGMFAFAIWDADQRRLFLARDHFGIKPLFFYRSGACFAFASELRTLARVVPGAREISPKALTAALNYLWVPTDLCILKGFEKLRPGHFMWVHEDGSTVAHRYWSPPDEVDRALDEAGSIELLDSALNASMDRHLVADVEVASFLSGGLDSSIVSVLAAKRLGALKTFTIGIGDAEKRIEAMSDDQRYAEQLARLHGFEHQSIVITPDLVEMLPKMVDTLGEPIGDPAALNTYLICSQAREAGIKVLLSGMGADELLFGYRRQKAWLLAHRYRALPKPVRALAEAVTAALPVRVGRRGLRLSRWSKKFMFLATATPAESYRLSYSYYRQPELAGLIREDFARYVGEISEDHQALFESAFQDDPHNRLCYVDIHMFMEGLNLTYTDRASMATSTELRVPFIDRDFVDAAMRIPGQLKFSNGQSKHVLKRVAERYLPKEIVYRPKSSFGAPLRAWISGPLREMVDDLLTPDRIKNRQWLDPLKVRQIIDADRAGVADRSFQIYQMLTLELWAQAYLD